MGEWTDLGGYGGPGSGPLTFGNGFNVNGSSVQFALDDPSNMLYDPGFEDSPPLAQWTQAGGGWSIDTGVFFQGLQSVKGTHNNSSIQERFHCDPFDQFLASIYSKTTLGASGSVTVSVQFFDAHGTFISTGFQIISATTTWIQYTASFTAPSNAAFVAYVIQMNTGITGTWYFDNASLRRITLGNNIAVGVVNTQHLAPGSLGDFSKYSSTIRAVGITNGLPTLPSANFPAGAIILNTFDGKLYRTQTGASWNQKTDPQDILAGTIAAGVAYIGSVNAAQVTAGTIAAAVTMTAPTIISTNGFAVAELSNGEFLSTNTAANLEVQINAGVINIQYAGGGQPSLQLQNYGLSLNDSSGFIKTFLSTDGSGNSMIQFFNPGSSIRGYALWATLNAIKLVEGTASFSGGVATVNFAGVLSSVRIPMAIPVASGTPTEHIGANTSGTSVTFHSSNPSSSSQFWYLVTGVSA